VTGEREHGAGPLRAGPRRVHVGGTYLGVESGRRLAADPAPAKETVRAEELAAALRDLRRDPAQAVVRLERLVAGATTPTASVEELVELAHDLANLTDPAIAAKRAEPILARVVRDYREGRLRDVVRLVWALLSVYLLYERWRALVALLHLDRLAAEALGDMVEAARALGDLGLLAEVAGEAPLAVELHEQARDLLDRAGDHGFVGAGGSAVTSASPAAVPAGAALGAKVAAVLAGTLLVAGGAAGFVIGDGGWYGLGGGDDVRPGGDADVTAFAVRSDSSELGTRDERAGWSPPEDAVGPGDELDSCEPLYLYAFVAFDGMRQETAWSVEARNEGEEWRSLDGTWNFEPTYTERFWADRGGQVIPYGSWTFVVTIGGEEVDEAAVRLVESCRADQAG
jgi:hypothetical protein